MKSPESLKYFIKKIDALKKELYLIILFGSFVRGEPGPYSDIDLLIITKRQDRALHDEIVAIAEEAMALTDYEELLSPHVVPLDHYNRLRECRSDFYQTLCDEGRELWKAA
ncbi:MAG: nucleotidyltransferase domain-containing protein [Pseudomonadota bacterium]